MKVVWQLLRSILGLPGYKPLLVLLWLLILTLFLWLPQANLLSYIVTQAPLDASDKLSFFLNYYTNVLSNIGNPIVLSMVVFSMLTAVSIVLLFFMIRASKRLKVGHRGHGKAYSGVAAAAVGSHVLSCGGTLLLASVFPAFSGTSAVLGGSGVTVNLWLSTGANLIGIAIVLYTINKLAKDISNTLLAPQTSKRSVLD